MKGDDKSWLATVNNLKGLLAKQREEISMLKAQANKARAEGAAQERAVWVKWHEARLAIIRDGEEGTFSPDPASVHMDALQILSAWDPAPKCATCGNTRLRRFTPDDTEPCPDCAPKPDAREPRTLTETERANHFHDKAMALTKERDDVQDQCAEAERAANDAELKCELALKALREAKTQIENGKRALGFGPDTAYLGAAIAALEGKGG